MRGEFLLSGWGKIMANFRMEREARMRNLTRYRAAATGDWTWPFDMTLYENRSSELSLAERNELSLLAKHFEARQHRLSSQMIIAAVSEETPLTRLICPLCDLLDVAGAYAANRFIALRVLLQEVHRRQQTYWGWSREDWIELLCRDSRIFMQRYHATSGARPYLITTCYLLTDCVDFRPLSHINLVTLANAVFGKASVQAAIQCVAEVLQQWEKRPSAHFPQLIAQLLLATHSPRLQDVRREVILSLYSTSMARDYKAEFVRVSSVLTHLGIIEEPIGRSASRSVRRRPQRKSIKASRQMVPPPDVPLEWATLCQRWREEAGKALTPATRRTYYHYLLKIGRWLQRTYPQAGNPSLWTPELAEECASMVNNMRVGEWTNPKSQQRWAEQQGRSLARETKDHYLLVLSIFFQDCAQHGWITLCFDPGVYFLSPSQRSYMDVRRNVSSG